jgi:hypothetical protein
MTTLREPRGHYILPDAVPRPRRLAAKAQRVVLPLAVGDASAGMTALPQQKRRPEHPCSTTTHTSHHMNKL